MEFLAFTIDALTEHSARFLTHEAATEFGVYLMLADLNNGTLNTGHRF